MQWRNVQQALKAVSKWNFLLSAVLFLGYIIFCMSQGIDIAHRWGVVEPGRRGSNFALVAVLELQLLAAFIITVYLEKPDTLRSRIVYIIWGAIILLCWFKWWTQQTPSTPLDFHIVGYVGLSNVLYGIIGKE